MHRDLKEHTMKPKSLRRLLCSLATALCLAPGIAAAQQGASGFPSRPVHIIMPVPAGGASDASARLLAQALSNAWGQPVVVENKPGAGGSIAAQAVLLAAPDGHTLLWGLSSMAGTPFVQKTPPFRSLADFAPVAAAVEFGYALYVHHDVPAQTFAQLQALARTQPGQLNYATNTLGEYMASVEVLKPAGIQAVRIPYKGGSQLMTDLVGGQVHLNVGPILGGLPHIRAGKLRALAVLTAQRSPLLPEVPTLIELGLPPAATPTWNALFAPPGTPREITEKIAAAATQALQAPALRATLEQRGTTPLGGTPQQLAQAVEAATQTWKTFVRDYDIPQESP